MKNKLWVEVSVKIACDNESQSKWNGSVVRGPGSKSKYPGFNP